MDGWMRRWENKISGKGEKCLERNSVVETIDVLVVICG